ncbi:carbohydrate porin [Thalassotalea litorea]|uniref:Carbohydrate porin n=1 Tax=Thalassotalea litorea TaxID=2020715 RepID=A0A5R9IH18_9GAMM|nr:carbohydrate porin [Thalassotalea litorea]TLU64830.1 carbohydrate porin [Thalassotalea litorea]
MNRFLIVTFSYLLLTSVFAQTNGADATKKKHAGLSGPASVEAQLEDAARTNTPLYYWPDVDKALQPWFAFKDDLYQTSGFKFGIFYNALYQHANKTLPDQEDTSALGIIRFNGAWDILRTADNSTGTLYFNVDNRHKLATEIAPADMASQIGYAGMTGTLFSDVGTVVVDLNYQHRFNQDQGGIVVGRFDPSDYVFVSGYANPWTSFQNVAVLLNPAVALPDVSWGIGAGSWVNDQIYMLATINDANGTVTDNLEFLSGGSEFFTAAEVGWSPASELRFNRQINLSIWHADQRDGVTFDDSHGVAISASWLFDDVWMPIMRLGWSEGEAPIYNRTATVGLIYRPPIRSDEFGMAVNWGRPAVDGLTDQITTEVFYKLQFSQNLAITPSLQYLRDPALHPTQDAVTIFGLRFRLTL